MQRRCEHVVVLIEISKTAILNAGFRYDKRQDGGQGRCLKGDVPSLGLLMDDRLEPNPNLLEVDDFKQLRNAIEVCLWKVCKKFNFFIHINPFLGFRHEIYL